MTGKLRIPDKKHFIMESYRVGVEDGIKKVLSCIEFYCTKEVYKTIKYSIEDQEMLYNPIWKPKKQG